MPGGNTGVMRCPGLVLIVPALLASCSEARQQSHLAESAWRFDLIDGKEPDTRPSGITFEGEHIGIKVGCSSLQGPWHVDAGRLFAGPLAQSGGGCIASSAEQGSAVNALLVATPRITLQADRMTLQSSGHTAQLVRVDGGR